MEQVVYIVLSSRALRASINQRTGWKGAAYGDVKGAAEKGLEDPFHETLKDIYYAAQDTEGTAQDREWGAVAGPQGRV